MLLYTRSLFVCVSSLISISQSLLRIFAKALWKFEQLFVIWYSNCILYLNSVPQVAWLHLVQLYLTKPLKTAAREWKILRIKEASWKRKSDTEGKWGGVGRWGWKEETAALCNPEEKSSTKPGASRENNGSCKEGPGGFSSAADTKDTELWQLSKIRNYRL